MARTDGDTRQLIEDSIASGDWWILVDSGHSDLPRLIEERHYSSAVNGDFQLVLGPQLGYQLTAFYLMRKSRMTAADLALCVRDAGGELVPPRVYERRPFLFSPRGSAPAVVVESFYRWLGLKK